MAVLGVGVMARMVAWPLNQTNALKRRDERTVFGGCPVRPFMDLVGVGPKDYDQPDLPGQHAA